MTLVQNFRLKNALKDRWQEKNILCCLGVKMHRKYQSVKKVSEVGIETQDVSTMPREAGEHVGYHITQG